MLIYHVIIHVFKHVQYFLKPFSAQNQNIYKFQQNLLWVDDTWWYAMTPGKKATSPCNSASQIIVNTQD